MRFAAASWRSASRTGVRDTLNTCARLFSSNSWPGLSSPEIIRSAISRRTRSDRITGTSITFAVGTAPRFAFMITTERLRFRAAGMDGMGVLLSSAQRLYTAEELLYIGPRKIRRELGSSRLLLLRTHSRGREKRWPREHCAGGRGILWHT